MGIAYLNSLTDNRSRRNTWSTTEILIETEKTIVTTVRTIETTVV